MVQSAQIEFESLYSYAWRMEASAIDRAARCKNRGAVRESEIGLVVSNFGGQFVILRLSGCRMTLFVGFRREKFTQESNRFHPS